MDLGSDSWTGPIADFFDTVRAELGLQRLQHLLPEATLNGRAASKTYFDTGRFLLRGRQAARADKYATLEWVCCYRTKRPLGPIGDMPPTEYEPAGLNQTSLRRAQGGSLLGEVGVAAIESYYGVELTDEPLGPIEHRNGRGL